MPAAPIVYQALPGHGTSGMEYHHLYLDPDHLMLLAYTGFSESYRRFYFREIQVIQVRKTAQGAVQNGLLAGLLLFCLLGLASGSPGLTTAWLIGWSLPFALFSALLVINLVRGPTCDCEIRTAIQTRRLGCVGRLGAARQFLARLQPLMDAAQGAVPPEQMRERIDSARLEFATTPPLIRW